MQLVIDAEGIVEVGERLLVERRVFDPSQGGPLGGVERIPWEIQEGGRRSRIVDPIVQRWVLGSL